MDSLDPLVDSTCWSSAEVASVPHVLGMEALLQDTS